MTEFSSVFVILLDNDVRDRAVKQLVFGEWKSMPILFGDNYFMDFVKCMVPTLFPITVIQLSEYL